MGEKDIFIRVQANGIRVFMKVVDIRQRYVARRNGSISKVMSLKRKDNMTI